MPEIKLKAPCKLGGKLHPPGATVPVDDLTAARLVQRGRAVAPDLDNRAVTVTGRPDLEVPHGS